MNITKSRKIFMVLTACFTMAAIQVPASAAFINGGIGFGGLFDISGGSGGLDDATGIDIFDSAVTTTSGDFTAAGGFSAAFNHINFNPANTPISSLWTVDTGPVVYTFDLLEINVDNQDANLLNLSGSGTLMATGFDATPGEWTFSGQQGSILFSFSSITTAIAEPGTALLLAIGFLGLAAVRKRIS